jgi:hypothetical protein
VILAGENTSASIETVSMICYTNFHIAGTQSCFWACWHETLIIFYAVYSVCCDTIIYDTEPTECTPATI